MFDIKLVKRYRKKLGLTQYGLAKAAGVSQSLIAKLESGRIDPSYSTVTKIELVLTQFKQSSESQAKDIMTKKFHFVKPNDKVSKAISLMQRHEISQLPVLKNNQVIGLITEASILSKKQNPAITAVSDCMEAPPPIVSEKTSASVLSALLKQFSLVLVVKNTKPVGVVTKADLLAELVK